MSFANENKLSSKTILDIFFFKVYKIYTNLTLNKMHSLQA